MVITNDALQRNDDKRVLASRADIINWADDNSEIVICGQAPIAILECRSNQIEIRQQDPLGDEDDVIVVSLTNLPILIAQLQQFASGGRDQCPAN
jgi:hypothetical protein